MKWVDAPVKIKQQLRQKYSKLSDCRIKGDSRVYKLIWHDFRQSILLDDQFEIYIVPSDKILIGK